MTTIIDKSESPHWANWLGIMAIVFGILLFAMHGTEILRLLVHEPGSAAVQNIPPRCPEYDLEKDGLSVEYCEALVDHIRSQIIATPDWFRSFKTWISIIAAIVSLVSVYAGIALIDNRSGAARFSVLVFSALVLIDGVEFLAVYNAGPLLRAVYLWHVGTWLLIHLMMTAAVIAGIHNDARQSVTTISDEI